MLLIIGLSMIFRPDRYAPLALDLIEQREAFFNVLFSGLLVALYLLQWRVQAKQSEISSKQAEITANQEDLMALQHKPRVELIDKRISPSDEESDGDIELEVVLENKGDGVANNVMAGCDVILRNESENNIPFEESGEDLGLIFHESTMDNMNSFDITPTSLGDTLYANEETIFKTDLSALYVGTIDKRITKQLQPSLFKEPIETLSYMWDPTNFTDKLEEETEVISDFSEAMRTLPLSYIDAIILRYYIKYTYANGEEEKMVIENQYIDVDDIDSEELSVESIISSGKSVIVDHQITARAVS